MWHSALFSAPRSVYGRHPDEALLLTATLSRCQSGERGGGVVVLRELVLRNAPPIPKENCGSPITLVGGEGRWVFGGGGRLVGIGR